MTKIPGGRIEFWRKLPIGGLGVCGDVSHADFAIVHLPTLAGGSCKFDLATDRQTLDGFLLGLSHGAAIGQVSARNDMRAALGVEVLREHPEIKGPRRHA